MANLATHGHFFKLLWTHGSQAYPSTICTFYACLWSIFLGFATGLMCGVVGEGMFWGLGWFVLVLTFEVGYLSSSNWISSTPWVSRNLYQMVSDYWCVSVSECLFQHLWWNRTAGMLSIWAQPSRPVEFFSGWLCFREAFGACSKSIFRTMTMTQKHKSVPSYRLQAMDLSLWRLLAASKHASAKCSYASLA